jgi:hypothetical protein
MADRQISRDNSLQEIQEFEKLVGVDKYALDDNLEQQPDLFYRVSRAYEMASAEAEQAKLDQDKTYAELDASYREDMAKAGEKVTENTVKQAVAADPTMRAAIGFAARKREIMGRWRALKDAYSQRINVLRELTQLYSSGYFSDAVGNKAHRVTREVREEENRAARTRALAEQEKQAESPRTRSRRSE